MADISFKEVNVDVYKVTSTFSPSLTVVSWVLNETVIPLERYNISVYRGESVSELTQIAGPIPANTTTKFEDRTAKLKGAHRYYYYQIVAKNVETGERVLSPIEQMDGFQDKVGLYVIEEHDFLFNQVIGVPVYIYKKQTSGTSRCEECWDSILKRVKKSSCTYCHGTGFVGAGVGGYYNPVYTFIEIGVNPKIGQTTQYGKEDGNTTTTYFMSNYPEMAPGDLVFELTDDTIYRVVTVQQSEKKKTHMLQMGNLSAVNRSDIEYTIKVPDEIKERARKELNERKRIPEF